MTFPWPLSTDQKTCYDAEGTPVSCEASGQDAEENLNGIPQDTRFRLDGDTVFDTVTELYWCRNVNRFEFPYSWREALDCVAGMNHTGAHGHADWRLPKRRELFAVISHQYINPALPRMHPFSDVFPGYYWSADPCARLPDQSWYVHLGGGRIYRGMQNGAYLVWPVAGKGHVGQKTNRRFRIDGPIFVDDWTGRHWLHTGADQLCTWEEALYKVIGFNRERLGGITRWRLPNIRELESLVDLDRHSPALSDGYPFTDVSSGYWSSTTSVYEPQYAWVLYTQDGAVGVGFKNQPIFGTLAVSSD
jgi:hypothetical protein